MQNFWKMLVLLFLAWIIFNGRITLEIVIFGIVIVAAVSAFMCKFMDYSVKKELRLYKKIPQFLKYVFLLVKDIIKANVAVIKMILTRRAKELGYDAIHDTVHEMAKDEARHGRAFEGLLKRYFK